MRLLLATIFFCCLVGYVYGHGEGKYSVVGGKQYKIQHFEPGGSDDPSPRGEFTGGHGHFLIRKDGSIRQWGYWSQGGYEIAKTLLTNYSDL